MNCWKGNGGKFEREKNSCGLLQITGPIKIYSFPVVSIIVWMCLFYGIICFPSTFALTQQSFLFSVFYSFDSSTSLAAAARLVQVLFVRKRFSFSLASCFPSVMPKNWFFTSGIVRVERVGSNYSYVHGMRGAGKIPNGFFETTNHNNNYGNGRDGRNHGEKLPTHIYVEWSLGMKWSSYMYIWLTAVDVALTLFVFESIQLKNAVMSILT